MIWMLREDAYYIVGGVGYKNLSVGRIFVDHKITIICYNVLTDNRRTVISK